jgi:hypothetical protein
MEVKKQFNRNDNFSSEIHNVGIWLIDLAHKYLSDVVAKKLYVATCLELVQGIQLCYAISTMLYARMIMTKKFVIFLVFSRKHSGRWHDPLK